MKIDTTFDFRTDAKGKDPDSHSQTLKSYHRYLWSKPLPTGGELILDEKLVNHSTAGEFCFASDSIIHTFSYWKSYQNIIQKISKEDIKHFVYQSYTIGGMLIFPANKIDNKMTINGARGINRFIRDRIDLTLECIRLYYAGNESPLYDCLHRYKDFFALFSSFKEYVEFFLLQDLTDDCGNIRFFHPFEHFGKDTLPGSVDEYNSYMQHCLEFLEKRNKRIATWNEEN